LGIASRINGEIFDCLKNSIQRWHIERRQVKGGRDEDRQKNVRIEILGKRGVAPTLSTIFSRNSPAQNIVGKVESVDATLFVRSGILLSWGDTASFAVIFNFLTSIGSGNILFS
jgi:hypothetical protein